MNEQQVTNFGNTQEWEKKCFSFPIEKTLYPMENDIYDAVLCEILGVNL